MQEHAGTVALRALRAVNGVAAAWGSWDRLPSRIVVAGVIFMLVRNSKPGIQGVGEPTFLSAARQLNPRRIADQFDEWKQRAP